MHPDKSGEDALEGFVEGFHYRISIAKFVDTELLDNGARKKASSVLCVFVVCASR